MAVLALAQFLMPLGPLMSLLNVALPRLDLLLSKRDKLLRKRCISLVLVFIEHREEFLESPVALWAFNGVGEVPLEDRVARFWFLLGNNGRQLIQ